METPLPTRPLPSTAARRAVDRAVDGIPFQCGPQRLFAARPAGWMGALLLAGGILAGPAAAQSNDRDAKIVLESDKPCTLDYGKQITRCTGNVVVSQGGLQLRAESLEVRQTADNLTMMAQGTGAAPARARQTRTAGGETLEGQAQRIEYDSRSQVLKLTGAAQMRRMRGSTLADEVQGGTIVWNGGAETFQVEGGSANPTNPGGRVRAVITPPRSTTTFDAPRPAPDLQPSPALGDRR